MSSFKAINISSKKIPPQMNDYDTFVQDTFFK